MQEILMSITAVVGVKGCFVCDENGEILGSSLGSLARDHALSVAAYTAAQTLAGLRMARRKKPGDLDLLYLGGRVLIRPLSGGCLFIACEPHVNIPLLSLTGDVAISKLQALLRGKTPPPVAAARPAPAAAAPAEPTRQEETSTAPARGLNSFLRPFGR